MMPILLALLLWFSSAVQAAAPTFQAAGGRVGGTGGITVAWPAHAAGDIALLIVQTANQAIPSTPTGFAMVTGSPQGTGTAGGTAATRLNVYWVRATSSAMPNVAVADSGNNQVARIITFRGVIETGNPWDITIGDVAATASTGFTIPGATTTINNDLVVAIVANGTDTTTLQTSGWANASLSGLTEVTDVNNGSGNGGGFGVAVGVKSAAGAYGNTTGTLLTASVQGRMSIALKPKITSLGDGINPTNVTLAPGGAITPLDAFTLVTNGGSDNVSGVTVSLAAGTGAALGSISIMSNCSGGTTYFSAIANPGDTVNFSGGTAIPVTASTSTYYVCVTPKSHAAMPVPPGLSYSVTGTVTAFITSTSEHSGADSTSATVTVDNLSPAGATTVSGSAGGAKNTLNWTTSSSTDFNTTSGSVVYRWAAGTTGSEVPAEGSTPTVGSANGTATVACVVSSAASTALIRIDGTGGSADCTTVALTNGQAYSYKIFQKDSNGNYDVGVALGTFTPTVTTIADGVNPTNSTIAPSAAITDLDAFTLATSNGTDSVTALTVTLAGTNSFESLSEVRITSSDGSTTYFSAVTNPASNTVSFSGGTAIPVSATATTFKVRITPKTHANMPVPPGLSYSVTGTVTGFTSTKAQSGADGTSATVTVDNLSPVSATAVTGNSDDARLTLNWTTSSAADFTVTGGSVVYRWAAGTAGSEVPVEGSTPSKGDTNGTATVACVVSSAASTALVRVDGTGGSADCTTAALTNGQAYTYKIFQKDSHGNYDVGVVVGPITPAVVNCTSNATGNWSASSTWTQCRNGIPLAGDSTTIANGHNVTLNVNTPTLTTLTINSGGTLTNTGSNTITLSGAMSNAGIYSGGSGAVTVAGSFTNTASYAAGSATTTLSGSFSNSGTFTAGTGTWVFSGSSAQALNGVTSFNNLTVNNANGVSLNGNVSVASLLTLTSGTVNTGAYKLITSTNCPASISRTGGYVNGRLTLTFPSGTATCIFHVGSGTNYAPISVTVVTMPSGGGTLTGSTSGYEHPQIADSGIDPTLDVNRYWSLWSSGDTVSASSYSPTFNFVAGDVDALATPANFVIGKYASSVWTLPTPVTAGATSTGVTIATGITAQTDFAVGEASFVCSVPTGSPAGTTCVCDNFNRASLNPSTIYNGNWNVSSSGGTFFLPQIVNNKLRLTNNSTGVSAAATGPGTFPAAGNWITVEFKHYAYNGTGADGMAFILSDSLIPAVPGAFGGSLGYAQKSNPGSDCTIPGGCPGFTGGWIGIALDEYGNYSSNTEGRTGGSAPGLRADSVAARGSGSGQIGYPYLGGTATLTPGIDNAGSTTPAYGYAYRLTVDARDYTWNGGSGTKTAIVSVERDTTGVGNSYTALLPPFDAYQVNPSQANVPVSWQFSFTGSTGASTNIHEIVGLKICAQTYVPPAGYRILVDNLSPTTCPSDPQPTVTISALNSSGHVITDYTNTVSLSATLLGGGASSATWTSQGTNQGTWDGVNKRYTFAAGDNGVAKFTLSDTVQQNVYITVSEYLGTLNSSLGTPVQYSSGVASFIVGIPPAEALGSGVVAGRAHLMSITRNKATCGGGVDDTFTGVKPLDGWYSPAVGDHPNGAAAPQICTPIAGTCLPSYENCETLSIAPPVPSASSNNLNLTFAGGVANFCLVTTDVGKYSLSLRDDTTVPATPVTGSSITLTARPFVVAVSDVNQGWNINPASSSPGGNFFAKAGTGFEATVGGYLWNSNGDGNGDGLPDANATFVSLTDAGIAPHYADTVTLAAGVPFYPVDGIAGALSNGIATVTGGSATPSSLKYSEVGTFTLTAAPTTNYLNSGVNLTNRTAIFTGDLNARTSLVGRFIPDHFALTSETVTPACNTFSYFGQDGFTTMFQLNALNATGNPTLNYTGSGGSSSWAKLPLTAWGAAPASAGSPGYGFATGTWLPSQPTGAAIAASATLPTATPSSLILTPINTWVLGSAYITAKHQITRPTSLAVPTTVNVTALPVDSDGVTMTTAVNLVTGTPLRYGRLNLQNAYGSELLDLFMPLTAEYWDGTGWVSNTEDNCTALVAPTSGSGLVLNLANGGTTTATLNNPLVSGDAGLSLSAPGATHTGYVDVTIDSPAWLDFNWQGIGDTDPSARATFGIYKGNNKFIYIRELY